MSYEDLLRDGNVPRTAASYHYGHLGDLTREELFGCVFVEVTCEQLGIAEPAAVFAIIYGRPSFATRGKFGGAIQGTSLVSRVSRALLDVRLGNIRLPAPVGTNIFELRIRWTSHLGAFAGRWIPYLGWTITAYDLVAIGTKAIARFNKLVEPEDRLVDATAGTLG